MKGGKCMFNIVFSIADWTLGAAGTVLNVAGGFLGAANGVLNTAQTLLNLLSFLR